MLNDTLSYEYKKLSTYFEADIVDYRLDHENNKATINFKLNQNREPKIISVDEFRKIVAKKFISNENGKDVEVIGQTTSTFDNKEYEIIVYKDRWSERLCFRDKEDFLLEYEES